MTRQSSDALNTFVAEVENFVGVQSLMRMKQLEESQTLSYLTEQSELSRSAVDQMFNGDGFTYSPSFNNLMKVLRAMGLHVYVSFGRIDPETSPGIILDEFNEDHEDNIAATQRAIAFGDAIGRTVNQLLSGQRETIGGISGDDRAAIDAWLQDADQISSRPLQYTPIWFQDLCRLFQLTGDGNSSDQPWTRNRILNWQASAPQQANVRAQIFLLSCFVASMYDGRAIRRLIRLFERNAEGNLVYSPDDYESILQNVDRTLFLLGPIRALATFGAPAEPAASSELGKLLSTASDSMKSYYLFFRSHSLFESGTPPVPYSPGAASALKYVLSEAELDYEAYSRSIGIIAAQLGVGAQVLEEGLDRWNRVGRRESIQDNRRLQSNISSDNESSEFEQIILNLVASNPGCSSRELAQKSIKRENQDHGVPTTTLTRSQINGTLYRLLARNLVNHEMDGHIPRWYVPGE